MRGRPVSGTAMCTTDFRLFQKRHRNPVDFSANPKIWDNFPNEATLTFNDEVILVSLREVGTGSFAMSADSARRGKGDSFVSQKISDPDVVDLQQLTSCLDGYYREQTGHESLRFIRNSHYDANRTTNEPKVWWRNIGTHYLKKLGPKLVPNHLELPLSGIPCWRFCYW